MTSPERLLAFASLLAVVGLSAAAARNPESELREAEAAWARAVLAGDAATLSRILADDLTYTHSSGLVQTKPQLIESLASGQLKYESAELEDMRAKVYGNLAVVFSLRRMRSGSNGQMTSFRARFQRVWLKRQGKWQLIAHQATRLAN